MFNFAYYTLYYTIYTILYYMLVSRTAWRCAGPDWGVREISISTDLNFNFQNLFNAHGNTKSPKNTQNSIFSKIRHYILIR